MKSEPFTARIGICEQAACISLDPVRAPLRWNGFCTPRLRIYLNDRRLFLLKFCSCDSLNEGRVHPW